MFGFLTTKASPIGVDTSGAVLRLVQLDCQNGNGVSLVAGGSRHCPPGMVPGSAAWQRWAVSAIKAIATEKRFKGKKLSAAIPATDVFIEHIKMPRNNGTDEALMQKVTQRLPFDANQAMIKIISAEQGNYVVIAAQKEKINRYLAVYEKSNLKVSSLTVWPSALISSYVHFFGRRAVDKEAVVMLLDIEPHCTNVVICRHRNLLYARSIAIGSARLQSQQTEQAINQLVLELDRCRKQFAGMYRDMKMERLIFVCGQAVDKDACSAIAKKLKMPAQMGDCLKATELASANDSTIDRRDNKLNWATAFGLSLS